MTVSEMSEAERSVRASQTGKIFLWLAVVAALAWFALVNTDRVNVDWVVGSAKASLALVIGVSAAAGMLVGLILGRLSSRPGGRH